MRDAGGANVAKRANGASQVSMTTVTGRTDDRPNERQGRGGSESQSPERV